jgi:hypothetical protein
MVIARFAPSLKYYQVSIQDEFQKGEPVVLDITSNLPPEIICIDRFPRKEPPLKQLTPRRQQQGVSKGSNAKQQSSGTRKPEPNND